MEAINFKLVALSGFVGLALYCIYRVLEWAWFRPKRLEKCLREQGFKGNPYRLVLGDQYENGKLMKEAMSKPIAFDNDVKKRVIPHILKSIETHGTNSFTWVGPIPRLLITEPELIKEVLTKYYMFQKNLHDNDPITEFLLTGVGILEGDEWAKRRKIIKSAFRFEKLKSMLPTFYSCCRDLVTRWEQKVPDGGSAEVDVWHDFRILTGDVISRTLFGSNYDGGRRIFELLKELTILTIDVIRSVYIPGQRFLPTKRNNRMRAINREVSTKITDIINQKMKKMQAGETAGNDFLGRLLEYNMNELKEEGSGMTIKQIIDECKLFYFAGQDTTSTLLVWTLIFLSRYQEWQARAREEVLQVFGDTAPDYDRISNLKNISMILFEVLRLYTPIVELTKVAQEDTQLGKYFIPAGVHIIMPQILLHHDPNSWGDDVMEFKPERFAEGVLSATKMPGSYYPFSLGPRMCIGQNFALLEAKMAMALILRRFSVELSPSYVHAPYTLISLQPQYGAHVILRKL